MPPPLCAALPEALTTLPSPTNAAPPLGTPTRDPGPADQLSAGIPPLVDSGPGAGAQARASMRLALLDGGSRRRAGLYGDAPSPHRWRGKADGPDGSLFIFNAPLAARRMREISPSRRKRPVSLFNETVLPPAPLQPMRSPNSCHVTSGMDSPSHKVLLHQSQPDESNIITFMRK